MQANCRAKVSFFIPFRFDTRYTRNIPFRFFFIPRRFADYKWRENFFVVAREFFASQTKREKFSHHVLWDNKRENSRA